MTILCILLFPRYEFLYDLVILGLVLACMGWQGVKESWRPGERVILMLGFLTPI